MPETHHAFQAFSKIPVDPPTLPVDLPLGGNHFFKTTVQIAEIANHSQAITGVRNHPRSGFTDQYKDASSSELAGWTFQQAPKEGIKFDHHRNSDSWGTTLVRYSIYNHLCYIYLHENHKKSTIHVGTFSIHLSH